MKIMKKITVIIALLICIAVAVNADEWKSKGYSWSGTAGTTIATGDVLCLDATLGKLYPAKIDNAGRAKVVGVAGNLGQSSVEVVTQGLLYTTDLTSQTIGAKIYPSTTAGKFTASTTSTQNPIAKVKSTTTSGTTLIIQFYP